MAVLYREFPDAEAVVAEWLRGGNLDLVGARVYPSIPEDPTYPLITLARIGGVPAVRQYLDAANIQIDAWGGTKQQAHDIAAAARVRCQHLEGQSVITPVEAFISAVEDSLGMVWFPDELTGRERYLFSMTFYCRGL